MSLLSPVRVVAGGPRAVLANVRKALPDVELPADSAARAELAGERPAVVVESLALAASVSGLAASVAGRFVRIPVVPTALTAAVTFVDNQPRLRGTVERALGDAGAELAMAAATAVANGLSGGTASLAVDTAQRLTAVRAERERSKAVNSAVRALGPAAAREASAPATEGPPREGSAAAGADRDRPVPVPAGPIERLTDRAGVASLAAAGPLAVLTRSVDTAAQAVLIGIPKAAIASRKVYGDALTVVLSRRGVLVRRPDTLRLLDRIDTLVVDSAVLLGKRPLVVGAESTADGWTREQVWSAGQRLLWRPADLPIPPPPAHRRHDLDLVGFLDAPPGEVAELILVEEGQAVGTLQVSHEPDVYADATLAAAIDAGLRLVITAGAGAGSFSGRADSVVTIGDPDRGRALADVVRTSQADGAVVMAVTRESEALAAADVGVGLVGPDRSWPLAADLLVLGGLREVSRILAAIPQAREVSQRGVRLSLGASFVGGLLAAVGRSRPGGATLPVHAAAGSAVVSALAAARRLDRRHELSARPLVPWHALEPDEVLARLAELPEEDVRPAVPEPAPGTLRRLVSTVRAELADPLTPVLATGAAASAVIGSPTDAILVGSVLAANAVVSGVQRLRAEQAVAALFARERPIARVVTEDGVVERPAADLAVGAVIELQPGDVVPADARLLEQSDLEVDEAGLTGESVSVPKQVRATPGAELPDRASMVYEATTVLAGRGRAVVVAVGSATEAGRALVLARRGQAPAGMQARLEELTRRGLPITLLGGAAVTGLGLLRLQPLRSAISSGVSVAVAAVPEGLPLVATVAQVSAARRLSLHGVLVRSARTLEALGRVDTVCFDKTGTLTEGRLRVQRVAGLSGEWSPTDPQGAAILRSAARACPSLDDGQPLAHATDRAIVDAARAAFGEAASGRWQELSELPFHSDRGFSAAVGRAGDELRIVVKGAPEVILPRCVQVDNGRTQRRLTQAVRGQVDDVVHSLASQGLRVLAVARGRLDDGVELGEDLNEELADSLTLLGFVALADSLRPEAADTVALLEEAGIATVMITGDHPVTARAIAAGLGIPTDRIVTGPELAAMDENERARAVSETAVFARVSPEQKLRIVRSLQRAGRIIAMTGDGANDAAAIRLADVGIGMAADASMSARSAADLVLTRPDLSVLPETLIEGRALWHRVRDAVAILLGGNAGEVTFTLAGTALAGRAPINTRQFLLVNMLTDMLPAMAIALAATPSDADARRDILLQPRPSLGAPLLKDIGVRGATTAGGALLAWQIGRLTGTRRRADTMALAALVGTQLGQTLVVGGRNKLVVATGLGSAAALVALIQTPGVSQFFGCRPMGPVAWATVTGSAAAATAASLLVPRLVPALRSGRVSTRYEVNDEEMSSDGRETDRALADG